MRFPTTVAASLSLSFATLALALAGCAVTPLAETSKELKSKPCDIAVKCAPGYHSVDTDGDGCDDTCEIDVCDTAIKCAPGYHSVDTDGDGCNDTCEIDGK